MPAGRCLVPRCAPVLVALLAGLIAGIPTAGRAASNEWLTYAGGPRRLFFNAEETWITADNADRLRVKWAFHTDAIVTASPSVARLDVPGEGVIPVAFIQSWDGNMYAIRVHDGTELWRFAASPQPGASFPNAGSAEVADVGGVRRVYFGAGEMFYCLDAVTGDEVWHFAAGTDCSESGLCAFDGERNEIESSPVVADGKVFFGMDVNEDTSGKGGFYALDASDGRLVWFFDAGGRDGDTCRPFASDNIRRFDGYHTEAELGLPAGFFSTRPGCDFDRTPNGCGNIWSSAALDSERGLIFFATSNCNTSNDPATGQPSPPMPPYNEAIVALGLDGAPAWRWRPREVDNNDLAWGAVPNLFTIDIDGTARDVVGAGNKDGTYYVIDREGMNTATGVRWDDADPSALPYWQTQVVDGGSAGGILATAAVDEAEGRIYFSTAVGEEESVLRPQLPTVHALDMTTGAVLWGNTTDPEDEDADASFAPTSAVPGVVFAGSVTSGSVRAYDAATGEKLASLQVGIVSVASAPAVIDGIMMVGAGIGMRSDEPERPDYKTSWIPQDVTALCVPGTPHCPVLLSGKRLLIKDVSGKPAKRKIVILSKDRKAMATIPAPGAWGDPTTGGATLTIANPTTGASATIDLPAANWKGIGRPRGSMGYTYRDKKRRAGACKKVVIRKKKGLKALCSGEGITFALDGESQGSIRVTLSTGSQPHAYCMLFGGKIRKDVAAATGKVGMFRANNAPAPATCPDPLE